MDRVATLPGNLKNLEFDNLGKKKKLKFEEFLTCLVVKFRFDTINFIILIRLLCHYRIFFYKNHI